MRTPRAAAPQPGTSDVPARLLRPALCLLGFLALAELGYRLVLRPEGVGVWWVPQGLALAVLLVSPRRDWAALCAAIFLAETTSVLLHGTALPVAVCWGLASFLEALVGAWLLRRKLGAGLRLSTVRELLWFTLLGVLVAPLVGAPLGAGAAVLWLGAASFWLSALGWVLSDMLAILALTPVLVRLHGLELPRPRRRRVLEGAALFLGLALVTHAIFGMSVPHAYLVPLPYLIFPLMLWIALRFGVLGAACATLLVVALSVTHTVAGRGPFVLLELSTRERVWSLQAFLGVVSLSALALAAALEERATAERRQALLVRLSELFASSLDPEAALGKLTRLLVPELAPGCAVLLLRDGTEAPVAVAHAQSWQEEQLWTRLGAEPGADALRVPISTRGRSFGTLLLLGPTGGAPFGVQERHLAEEVARRTAQALETMGLFQERGEAIALRDEFLSVAAHELRTPLTSLHLQLRRLGHLLHENQPAETLEQKLQVVGRQVGRLNQLVESLLDVARLSRGRLELRPEHVDLADLVEDVAARLDEDLRRAGCALTLQLQPVQGYWDRLRIEQVLSNLLANAIKFAPGQPIEVAVRPTDGDGFAQLSVRDHGPGVPAEARERIFGRFSRAVSSRWYGGLGLGLYVSSQIVEAHGGQLMLANGPQQGACFVARLPALPAQRTHWGGAPAAPLQT